MADDLNNIDKALIPKPVADVWDEQPEPTEPTTPSRLISGTAPDPYFAAAHQVGAELREQRRKGRPPRAQALPPRWLGPGFDLAATVTAIENGESVDYYDFLEVVKDRTKGLDKLPPKPDLDEWRDVPGYPG